MGERFCTSTFCTVPSDGQFEKPSINCKLHVKPANMHGMHMTDSIPGVNYNICTTKPTSQHYFIDQSVLLCTKLMKFGIHLAILQKQWQKHRIIIV